jgi:L-fuculose-phosphate aldolase
VLVESQVRQDICEVGRRLWVRGFVGANDGNISARLSEHEVLCTPTGVSKGFLTPDVVVKVDMGGAPVGGGPRVSSEIEMHLAIYRERPDVCGVLHAHPPAATGFAVAHLSLETAFMPEVIVDLAGVPLARYATPGTLELAESIVPYAREHDAFLLSNHGAVTLGRDVMAAYYTMERLELTAQIALTAHLLGGAKPLDAREVGRLMQIRESLGLGPRHESCLGCGACTTGWPKTDAQPAQAETIPEDDLRALVERVTRAVLEELRKSGS